MDKEHYMEMWDRWRKYFTHGGGGSWPRDAFESIIDYLEEIEDENKMLSLKVERLQTALKQGADALELIGRPETIDKTLGVAEIKRYSLNKAVIARQAIEE